MAAAAAAGGNSRPPPPRPCWAELPEDVLMVAFRKLEAADLLLGAGLVCRAWRRLALGEPELWRRVRVSLQGGRYKPEAAEAVARAAGDRAGRRMESFCAEGFGTDDLLRYMAERASSLKSLRLILCHDVTCEGLAAAIKSFPELEELEISFCSLYGNVSKSVGKACPRLKHFRLNRNWGFVPGNNLFYAFADDDRQARGIASAMGELQELQLLGSNLQRDELISILDSCPRLESLDIRGGLGFEIDDALRAKCARIKNLKLSGNFISDDDYYNAVDLVALRRHLGRLIG